jgi:hypothetical protein
MAQPKNEKNDLYNGAPKFGVTVLVSKLLNNLHTST